MHNWNLASQRANDSAGILNATLHHEDKSIDIDWSPPLASCIEFVTGLWIRVHESGIDADQTSEPYLSIPRKCLKSKLSGKESLSVLLPSNSSIQNSTECSFIIKPLVDCRSYHVEVIPDYQSLRGKSVNAEVVIPPALRQYVTIHYWIKCDGLYLLFYYLFRLILWIGWSLW